VYRLTEWGALVRLHPEAARDRLRVALRAAEGDVPRAAQALGLSLRGLHRYISVLGMRAELEQIRGDGR
jgi:transcriptional regulator with GAF, ATPase, and Fis domain